MGAHPRVRNHKSTTEFILAERAGQDAIGLGIQALVADVGITEDDIKQIIIAGAFSTFIDVQSAIAIGILPALHLERYKRVGNAAGTGARLA